MSTPLRYLVAAAAYLAPALLLASDVLLVMFVSTPGLLLQRVAFGVLIPAIAGVAVLAHHRAQWQVGAGAALAALGALAIVIRPAFLVAPTRPPAVLFPLGLLVLSGAMIGSTAPRRGAHRRRCAALPAGAHERSSRRAYWRRRHLPCRVLVARNADVKSQAPNPKPQIPG